MNTKLFTLFTLVTILLSSCSMSNSNTGNNISVNNNDNKVVEKKINNKTENNNVLKIISDRSDFHLKTIIKNFEKETWIKTELSSMDSGLLEKIKTRNNADIYISKDSSEIVIAGNEWLLWHIDQNLLTNVPKLNKNQNWFNMTYRDRDFFVKKWETNIPLNYEDLSNPKYKWRLCIRSLTHNYNVELISYMYVKHWAAYTKKWLEWVADNLARKPVWNDRNQAKGIIEWKVCDIALMNTYYMWLMLKNPEQRKWGEGLDIYFPNQNTAKEQLDWAIALFSAVWINKKDVNNENVKKFISYILNKKNQKWLSNENFEYPITTTTDSELVKSFGKKQNLQPQDIKLTKITQQEISKVRNQVLKMINMVELEKWL